MVLINILSIQIIFSAIRAMSGIIMTLSINAQKGTMAAYKCIAKHTCSGLPTQLNTKKIFKSQTE